MLLILYAWTMISGLNASLLGTLWPVMYLDFEVALSVVGVMSWIGSIVGLIANLSAGWFLRKFGAQRMTAIAGFIVALALFGYTVSDAYWMLCVLSIPCGLAGGIIGTSMNNYVAMHYPPRHMSWVHCMWGVGTIIGPNIVSYSLTRGYSWHLSYRFVFIAWALWGLAILMAGRRWKKDPESEGEEAKAKGMPLLQLIKIRGVKDALLTFFCYNSLEQGIMLWMSSYMVLHIGLAEELAATYASLFFIGITIGRMFNGFLTMKFDGDTLIRFGQILIAIGGVLLLLPLGKIVMLVALLVIGLGCAPVCPCLLHSTPHHFGKEHSQALVGVQVAASTLGNCILPSLFGLVANHISIALLPAYVFFCLGIMAFAHCRLSKVSAAG